MKQIRNIFILMIAALTGSSLSAAPTVKQVIIASGGHYGAPGNKVTFYTYDPKLKTTKAFDSVPGNFAREAIVDNSIIYITADSVLFRYNADTYKKIDSIVLQGVNRMAINGNYLIISRWYPASSAYVRVYDKTSLKLLYSDTHIKDFCQSIITLRDTAYIAVSSSDTGRIAVLDLTGSKPKYAGVINMDTTATFMQDLATDGAYIYTFSYDYSPGYKTRTNAYQVSTGKHTLLTGSQMTNVVGYTQSSKGSEVFGNINYQLQNTLYQGFNAAGSPSQTSSLSYYRGAMDSINNTVYLIDNNFVSNNVIHVLKSNADNSYVDSFTVGSSTEAIAMDYRGINTAIAEELQPENIDMALYPNPANSTLNIAFGNGMSYNISISDMTGRKVAEYKETSGHLSIPVTQYPKGIYIMNIVSEAGIFVRKFIKE